jgi:hypothetical protein
MVDLFSGRNLIVLYLILVGRFLIPLFPCTRLDSDLLRHIAGFVTLMLLCVAANSELDDYMPLGTLFASAVVVYFWFLIASKMTANWWIVVATLLAAIYFVDLYQEQEGEIGIKNILVGLALAITSVGFLIYVGEKKLDYKSKFDYGTLLFGTSCKGTPNIQPYWKSLGAAFMEAPRPFSGGFFDGSVGGSGIPPPPSSLPGDNF